MSGATSDEHRWWHRSTFEVTERRATSGGVLCLGVVTCERCGSWPARSFVSNADFERAMYGTLL